MDFMNEYVNGQLANPQFVNPYEEAATYERAERTERTGKSRRLSDALVSILAMVVLCIGAVSVLSKLGR